MKNSSRLSIILTGCVLLAVLSLAPPAGAVLTCGPGSHWVDGCTSGIDAFPSVATVGLDLNLDDVKDISVVLAGPTSIYRGDPVDAIIGHPQLGDVGTTDGHMDVIETEIISLTLTGGGITVRAGDGTGNLLNDGPLYSPGALREKPGDPTRALSFFDVFFELDTPFGTLHNIQPLRLESEIDRVPPIGFTYTHAIPNPIGLYDQQGNERARLVDATHTPVPEPSTWLLFITGFAGVVVWRRVGTGKWRNKSVFCCKIRNLRFIGLLVVMVANLVMVSTVKAYSIYTYGAGYKDRGSLEYAPRIDPNWNWNSRSLTYRFDTSVLTGLGYDTTEITTLTNVVKDQMQRWDSWGSYSFPNAPVTQDESVLFQFFNNTKDQVSTTDNASQQQHSTVKLESRYFVGNQPVKFTDSQTYLDAFKTFAFHEVGHVLGLADLYGPPPAENQQGNPYEDFIDHGLNQRVVSSAVGKDDNIMQALSGIIDNDEIAGLTWLWGEQFDQIVTGRLKSPLDAFGNTQQNEHHGPDRTPLETWYYRGTVKTVGESTIIIDAVGAYEAGAVDPEAWTTQIFPDHVVFTGTPATHGNFEFFVKSKNPEGFIEAQVNTSLFDLAINPSGRVYSVVNGVEHWPVVYGPVIIPEPSTLLLLSFGLVGLVILGRRGCT